MNHFTNIKCNGRVLLNQWIRKKLKLYEKNNETLTSSGTFSHSPFVAVSSFFDGFCLSFLLNENERNDHLRFFSFFGLSFFALSPFSVASSPPSDTLLSFTVSSPFSTGLAGADSLLSPLVIGASPSGLAACSFSVALSLSVSADSVSAFSYK